VKRRYLPGDCPTRIFVQHRRLCAIHEAGHIIAARSFGIDAKGMIWARRKTWSGLVKLPQRDELPDEAWRVIGLAGAVANMLWLEIPVKRFFWDLPQFMSRADWRLVTTKAGPRKVATYAGDVAKAARLLERERPALLSLARVFIRESKHHTPEMILAANGQYARASHTPSQRAAN
jgi:hypothetical protein